MRRGERFRVAASVPTVNRNDRRDLRENHRRERHAANQHVHRHLPVQFEPSPLRCVSEGCVVLRNRFGMTVRPQPR